MLKYMRLYGHFFKQQMKVVLEYRVDFIIGIISTILYQSTSILFLSIIFNYITEIRHWSFYEMLFIYGIAGTGRSIHHIFFDNLWVIGSQYIRTGNFDRLLVRPINPLFHLIADRVQIDGFGQLIIGLAILLSAMPHLTIQWSIINILLLILMIISSGLIFVAVNLFFSTFSFWIIDSFSLTLAAFWISDFARYPITIYNKTIRFIITWIIPYAFTAFYPAALFISHDGYKDLAILTPIVAIISIGASYYFWKIGIKHYVGTGT
ncbi:ABC transporter permease [Clostridium beijerinckii]|uniref:ABC transporter permease n=1 Tax=Clostridium beijerinckii TaxID=1520 RepID=UPI00047BF783|nr:ABC-2 family transporter protein [Clostridium beijerinckii]